MAFPVHTESLITPLTQNNPNIRKTNQEDVKNIHPAWTTLGLDGIHWAFPRNNKRYQKLSYRSLLHSTPINTGRKIALLQLLLDINVVLAFVHAR